MLASTYSSPEEVVKMHRHDLITDSNNTSAVMHTKVNSLLEAMTLFATSDQYRDFLKQHHQSWYFYCNDEYGNLIHVNLPIEGWHILEDIYT